MKRHHLMTAFLAAIAAVMMLPAIALADTQAPAHSKTLTDNKDGTYTLNLSVTGASSSSVSKTKANVIIVMDVSGSMDFHVESDTGSMGTTDSDNPRGNNVFQLYKQTGDWYSGYTYSAISDDENYTGNVYYRWRNSYQRYYGSRYTADTRLDVSKAATTDMIDQLAANNTSADDDTVEIAFETFSTYANQNAGTYGRWYSGSDMSSLKNAVNNLSAGGGTNWDDALHDATNVTRQKKDGDPTYYIFVSDGNPTYHMNENHTQRYGDGSNTTSSDLTAAYAEADQIKEAGYHFYGIGAFGNVSNMQTLSSRAGGSYFSVTDGETLREAFASIIQSITQGTGYEKVSITDGLTDVTASAVMEDGAKGTDFTYSIEGPDGTKHTIELNDDGTIKTVDGGTDAVTLTDSVGHSLTLTPGSAFPMATQSDGSVQWDLSSLGMLLNKYTYTVSFIVWPSQDAYDTVTDLYNGTVDWDDVDQDQYIRTLNDDGTYSYSVRTNTKATLNYTAVESVDGKTTETDGSADYDDVPSMPLTKKVVSVEKKWIGNEPDHSVTLELYEDGKATGKTFILNKDNGWKADAAISPGLKAEGQVLLNGHDYRLVEVKGADRNYEFSSEIYHPMLVDSATEITDQNQGDNVLTGTNAEKSSLNLSKTVKYASPDLSGSKDQLFKYFVKITDKQDQDIRFSIVDSNGRIVKDTDRVTGASPESESGEATGYYTAVSGSTVEVCIKAGEHVHYEHISTGSAYEITETDIPKGYTVSDISNNAGDAATDAANPAKTTGTVAKSDQNYGVEYTNTYKADPASASITAKKTLTGRDLKDSEFSFTLAAEDNAPMPEGAEDGKLTVKNDGTDVNFGNIVYTKAGTYRYTITEEKGDKGGVTYDSDIEEVTVTVTDNGSGQLEAVVRGDGDDAAFENTYSATPVSAAITAVKKLTGRDLKDGEFKFTLTAEDNAPMPQNAEDGAVTAENEGEAVNFGSITYDKAGTYHYTIREEKGESGGVTYDDSVKDVTVTVTDDGEGTLHAVVKGDGDDAAFRNSYEAKSATAKITAKKSMEGRDLKDGEFSFTLKAEDNAPMPEGAEDGKLTAKNDGTAVDFGSITYDKAGTYTYTVTEDPGSLGGVSYDTTPRVITVTVTDDLKGQLHAEVSGGGDDATFSNTYKTGTTSASITAVKKLTGRAIKDGEFLFTLTAEDNAPMPEGAGNGTITAENEGEAVNFGSITYDKAGTYHYTIREENGGLGGVTYDDSVKNVTVTVTDNGDGTLTAKVSGAGEDAAFNNKYKAASTKASVTAKKTLTGRDLADGEFSFTLAANDSAPMPEGASDGKLTVENSGTAVDFGSITYDKAGTYTYTVTENAGGLGGVSYDSTSHIVTVTVRDNLDGTMTASVSDDGENAAFCNIYKADPASASITAKKTLSGRNLKDGEFRFTLTAKDNAPMPEKAESGTLTVKNAGQDVNFGSITYTKAGTYHYTIQEENDGLGGVTYDDSVKDVTVTVTDDGAGKLNAVVRGDGSDAEFENTYSVTSTSASITAVKKLTGRDLADGEFSFTLAAKDNAPMPAGASDGQLTVENSGTDVDFGNISYTKAGTYHYTISEVKGQLGGITYDESEKDVTVTVTDNGDGTLTAAVDGAGKDATFTNVYKPEDVTLEGDTALKLTKKVEGHDSIEAFRFKLSPSDNATKEAIENKDLEIEKDTAVTSAQIADGASETVKFGGVTFHKAGNYQFTVDETTEKSDQGWTYDTKTHKINVTVTDNGNGQLEAAVEGNNPIFTNSYKTEPVTLEGDTALEVTKKVIGHASVEPFEFKLTPDKDYGDAVEGAEQTVKTSDRIAKGESETKRFDKITFKKTGTYEFTVDETTEPSSGGWTYDTQTHKITVVVTDNGKGQLAAEVKGNNPAFTNSFKPGSLSGDTAATGTKVLSGRDMLKDETFEFKLSGADDATKQAIDDGEITIEDDTATVTGAKDGEPATFTFGTINFSKVGTYEFAVRETKGNAAGLTYDDEVHTFRVEVTNDNGMLKAVQKNVPEFTNTYQAEGSYTPEGTKTLLNTDGNKITMKEGQFRFNVNYAGTDETVASGTNGSGKDAGITFDTLHYTVQGDNSLEELVRKGYAIRTKDGDTTKYTLNYTVTEEPTDNEAIQHNTESRNFTVVVTDDGSGELKVTSEDGSKNDFENLYKTDEATVDMNGVKTIRGSRPLKEGEFTFTITGSEGAPMPEKTEVKNDANGGVDFGKIKFTKDSLGDETEKTFKYKISESGKQAGVTNDTEKTVTVTVTDDGNGHITAETDPGEAPLFTFTNTYEPTPGESSVTDQIKVNKKLTGKSLKDGEFSFIIKDKDGNDAATGTNDKDGKVTMSPVKFSEAGTYTYTISEVTGGAERMTYDTSEYQVTAVVTDNYEGKPLSVKWVYGSGDAITFNNSYQRTPVSINPTVMKKVTGDAPKKDETYSFIIRGNDGAPMPDGTSGSSSTVKVKGEGQAEIGTITYDKTGTYTYTVQEVKGSDKNCTYDSSVFTLKVTVTEGDGTLVAKQSITKKGKNGTKSMNNITFTNNYAETPAPVPGKTNKIVKTGDSSSFSLWLPILFAAGAGLAGAAVYRKRRS